MMRSNTRERRGVGLESKQTAQTRIHDVGQGKATIQRLGRDFLLPHNNKVIMTVMSPRGTITSIELSLQGTTDTPEGLGSSC